MKIRKEESGCRYVVQAWHYAQYEVTEKTPGKVDVEILDEDDCGCVLVAVRDSAEEAEKSALDYDKACRVVPDSEDEMGWPICTINVWEVPASGPPRPAKFVKTVVDNQSGGGGRGRR